MVHLRISNLCQQIKLRLNDKMALFFPFLGETHSVRLLIKEQASLVD